MENMSKVYIHYGFTDLDKSRIKPIRNIPFATKPGGGLWASPLYAEFGWNKWCKREHFGPCRKENSFIFTLRPDANVLLLTHPSDLDGLPKKDAILSSWINLDFEQLQSNGIDAVEIDLSGGKFELYFPLYGWDCDSIVIFNPDIIVPKKWEDI